MWDFIVSGVFFAQHSGMVRTSFRNWLDARVPRHLHGATYSIASGAALAAVVLLWQPSPSLLYSIEGDYRILARAVAVLASAGFIWTIRALRHFDTFGLAPIRDRLRERETPASPFVLRGPYLWVRHPLYSLLIVLIWSMPDVTSDRLLFNLAWTAWIVLGAYLEERDLRSRFGDVYRSYQRTVPILVPWRGPVGRRLVRAP